MTVFFTFQDLVAPLAGARIEIKMQPMSRTKSDVAPLAGARIEICLHITRSFLYMVAPLAGARIEIMSWNI